MTMIEKYAETHEEPLETMINQCPQDYGFDEFTEPCALDAMEYDSRQCLRCWLREVEE